MKPVPTNNQNSRFIATAPDAAGKRGSIGNMNEIALQAIYQNK